jgi:hypothetical protein
MHSHLAGFPAGIGTVLTFANGCRDFIGPVPQSALDGQYSLQLFGTRLIVTDKMNKINP